jgi:phosphoenolpyruvate carboxylase
VLSVKRFALSRLSPERNPSRIIRNIGAKSESRDFGRENSPKAIGFVSEAEHWTLGLPGEILHAQVQSLPAGARLQSEGSHFRRRERGK